MIYSCPLYIYSHNIYLNFIGEHEWWIGLTNPNKDNCNSVASCSGKQLWMDSSNFTADSWYALKQGSQTQNHSRATF